MTGGFGQVSAIGEYYNQSIVNTFWYRSDEWLPGQGNPFDDVLAFVLGVQAKLQASYLSVKPSDYTLLRWEGVGYDDKLAIVTASPLYVTVHTPGTWTTTPSMGAAQSASLLLRCGAQHQIGGLLQSKRNYGYLAVGPVPEGSVDNYSHLSGNWPVLLEDLAQDAMSGINIVAPAVTLYPVRIHQVLTKNPFNGQYGPPVLGTTYSDVLGYAIPRVASYRRSRRPEA